MNRILILLLWASLSASCSNLSNPYAQYLPKGASEIKFERVPMGFDFANYMVATVTIEGFESFVKRMELKSATERFTPHRPDQISKWWNPSMKNEIFARKEYSKHSKTTLSNIYWATYENGKVFFNHSNF